MAPSVRYFNLQSMNRFSYFPTPLGFLLLLISCIPSMDHLSNIPANKVIPTSNQVEYQNREMIGFIHFTMNTFTDKEWGYGDEDPKMFNPTELDAEQWARVARESGLKELILTAKHHDGFCLWPSKYTAHSIKNSPYQGGNGDIVREFVDACRKYGLKAGLYLSPWDRNHPDYGKPEYLTYYRNQLEELLTGYGEIQEIWFDGANGGTGYYGGADEERRIDKVTYYDWDNTFALVKGWQPDILIFSDAGPDIRWIGNERGIAGETFWSTISSRELVIGGSDQNYLNRGEPDGDVWLIGQSDVSIRPGWFYHESQDSLVKTPQELVDIYYKSVGRNSVLLLNIPPDKRGLINEIDRENLQLFKQAIDDTFRDNLASGKPVTSSDTRKNSDQFSPGHITDSDPQSYWAAGDSVLPVELTVDLGGLLNFDRIMIQEPIRYGQRIASFQILAKEKTGSWRGIFEGTTIGHKRLIHIPHESATHIKIKILNAVSAPAISNLGLFISSEMEPGIQVQ